ncbi:S8 family peptidase [Desmospora profundinema]|uniref:Thermitase n=1 Tax=Desmospora profundinema TaxID=1571184 RepID=A0ABU1IKP4_9BACL|nr:S8 family peptidase [Desmospora profundinema]MDR6225346.1 thermitase [Desmospora profundinema]
MKRHVSFLSALLLMAVLMMPAAPDAHAAEASSSYVTGEVIVKFKDDVNKSEKASINGEMDAKTVSHNEQIGFDVVEVDGPVEEAIEEYNENSDVEFAEPNYIAEAYFEPNDPEYSKQYALQIVEAPKAWDVTKGSQDVKVAILDTGVDYNHEDLAGKVEKGGDYIDNDQDPMDEQGHGTHCAGIAAAATDNGIGIAGMAPDVTIYAVRVLDANGSGSYDAIAKGIIDAADAGSDVISMSLGGSQGSRTLEEAVNYAHEQGSVVVAAAGNSSTNAPSYPAYYENAIAVAATDENDRLANFSNYGDWVDVAAPGVNILSTMPNNQYQNQSGTSMATPYVAGLAGLIASQGKSGDEIREAIESSADKIDGTGSNFTHGRINAAKAVETVPEIDPENTKSTSGSFWDWFTSLF